MYKETGAFTLQGINKLLYVKVKSTSGPVVHGAVALIFQGLFLLLCRWDACLLQGYTLKLNSPVSIWVERRTVIQGLKKVPSCCLGQKKFLLGK